MEPEGKSRGGHARAAALTPEERSRIASRAAATRHGMIKATHGSDDHPLRVGDTEITAYVLEDGTRVLSQRGLQSGVGLSEGGGRSGARRIAELMASLAEKGVDVRDLVARANSPIRFIPPHGGNAAAGYEATILPDICAVLIDAEQQGKLGKHREHLAVRAARLQHGFATVGIIALVDEATGYQVARAADALAKILEAFIAKELQPWVKTFPTDYYRELFRLRGLPFPSDTVKRPQYFGTLTNDIVYKRLAPGVLEELKRVTPRHCETGRHKQRFFQRLSANKGYPNLRELLGSIVTIMKLSKNWEEFKNRLEMLHPKHHDTLLLPFEYDATIDDGNGI